MTENAGEVSGTGPDAGQPTPATNDQGPAQPQLAVDPTSADNTVTNPPEEGQEGDVNIEGGVASSGGETLPPSA